MAAQLERTVGFIGCGQMARALAKGFVSAGLVKPATVMLSDPAVEMLNEMKQLGFQTTSRNEDVVTYADVVVLAVKPQYAPPVLAHDLKGQWKESKLLVSICAGIPLDALTKALPTSSRVVRVMPNTPCLVNAAASCYCGNAFSTREDLALVHRMLECVGLCFPVGENLLDAVVGLSGSGPAYVYTMIEAMADAGVLGGLPRNVARTLAAQTVLGAAKMVIETGEHPGVLRDQVTSPAGTTIAAVADLEKNGFRNAVISAVDVARVKSEEMNKNFQAMM